ncbi:MAG: hypothetical protein WBB82_00015 [Limnothrix sp.]
MSRFSKIIDQLEDLNQQDLKHTAKVFGITATLYQKLQNIAAEKSPVQQQLSAQKVTQEQLTQRYGSYSNAYNAYKEAHGIKCRTGWKSLLPLVQNLPMPETLAEKVTVLEEKVAVLSEILLSIAKDI